MRQGMQLSIFLYIRHGLIVIYVTLYHLQLSHFLKGICP